MAATMRFLKGHGTCLAGLAMGTEPEETTLLKQAAAHQERWFHTSRPQRESLNLQGVATFLVVRVRKPW